MRFAISFFLLVTCVAFAGVAFGVNPIGPMPETYIGYRIGPVVPQLAVNYGNFSGSFEYRYEDDGEEYTGEGKISVLAPTLGTKVLFGSSDLQPFIRLSVGMPFLLSLKVDLDVDDPDIEDEVDDFLDELTEGLGPTFIFTGGAGIEYLFDERFSIGGEFKYRLVTVGGEWEFYEDEFINLSGSIGGTSAGLWLNFYF